ncbi:peptidylprolyl isomerase [Celeribacter marinus]|uniref:Parvulin-like PPIase n=1 Tax=Celeribacter marinus TaxID=1397108 RepID=A0A0N9ZWD2_9RHOB|nr:peptidylprolyl isomerase [Celeribacter marinus]ALI54260.1 survival protein SurA precursor (Peptidyl-prolyl cis-trans isomerase SurA) [Celeribacter marinus]SFK33361.1 periplasmic chaperone for outer membrane proteins SurA [Celeribacter marinus]
MTRTVHDRESHTQRRFSRMVICATLAVSLMTATLAPRAAEAQNLFAPVVQVNDQIITRYEIDQRIKLMTAIGGGATQSVAREALINERLQIAAARRDGLVATDAGIKAGIEEFAARGNLSGDELLAFLAKSGVAYESFRDFVTVGIVWRDYARARFASKVTISEAEIDRALQQNGPSGGLRVLLSEIFLPARDATERAASERLAANITAKPTVAAFAAAARAYSVAPSKDKSGRLDWVPLGNLPPALQSSISSLTTGGITAPLQTANAIGLFQLRGLQEVDVATPTPTSIEYAAYYIAGGRSEAATTRAAKVAAQVDTCDDLYGIAKGEPESTLEIDTLAFADIPTDVAVELAKLDTGEISTALTRANGQTLVFLMMCGRNFAETGTADRETVRNTLQGKRLTALADSYLSELKADAVITYK